MRWSFAPCKAIVRLAVCLAFYAGVGATPVAAQFRDWNKYPAIATLSTAQDVYGLGDIHGDYERLWNLLLNCKIIKTKPANSKDAQWNLSKAVLVCTGDLIDKGNDSVDVLLLMRALQASAQAAGGKVVITYGNHEAEFMSNPMSDKVKQFRDSLAAYAKNNNIILTPQAVAAGTDGLGLGAFLRSLPVACKVNDWFFLHAGYTRQRTVAQLEKEVRDWVDAHGFDPLLESKNDESMTNPLTGLLEARLDKKAQERKGVWWQQVTKQGLTAATKNLGVRHLVIGHQPGNILLPDGKKREKGTLDQKLDGLIFFIDVGMSRGIDGGLSQGALLRIVNGPKQQAFHVGHNGGQKLLWSAP
jgi:hypothetical protein